MGVKTHVRLVAAAAAGVAFAADQITKYWMIDILGIEDRPPIRLTPFLDIVLAWNPGGLAATCSGSSRRIRRRCGNGCGRG